MAYSNLFAPINIGTLKIKNRIALAPLDVGLHGPEGLVTETYINFLVERAKGETGLIITEFTDVWPEKRIVTTSVWDDKFIPGLTKMADAIKHAGAVVFMQLGLMGGKALEEPFAPSAIESELYTEVPREMTIDEIKRVIEAYINAASRAKKAGFDGVEYHCAHSYLGGQFISPHTNHRDDEYGGDFERRMRFGKEIVTGIRETCGEDFPVGFKFSAHEHLHGGVNDRYDEGVPDDLHIQVAHYMDNLGVAYLHVATTSSTIMKVKGFIECTHPSVPPMYIKPNTLIDLAKEVKASGVKAPVMGTGGITDPADAEQIIANGDADIIALGRALVADAHWARKAAAREAIVPCIRCNFCHTFVVMERGGIRCTTNPLVGREAFNGLKKTKAPKKIMIIGAGPAGLEAALRALRKGHNVVVHEQCSRIGGEMISASIPEFKWDIKRLLQFYLNEIEKTGMDIRLGSRVTLDTIKKEKPDIVIFATGGEAIIPDVPGINGDNVITAIDALVNWDNHNIGERVIVLGAGLVGYEASWHAAQNGRSVVMVSRRPTEEIIKLKEHGTNLALLIKGARDAGVRVMGGGVLKRVEPDGIILGNGNGKEEFHKCDQLIISRGYSPRKELRESLESANLDCEIYAAGDCVEVRNFFDAINEGAQIVLDKIA